MQSNGGHIFRYFDNGTTGVLDPTFNSVTGNADGMRFGPDGLLYSTMYGSGLA